MPRWSPFDPAIDQRLVRGLNEGEGSSLGTLYDRYAERLYDYTLSIVQDPSAAADIVHDTFIDAYRRAPRMRNREHLRPWLYAAIRRRCLVRVHGSVVSWDWDGEISASSGTTASGATTPGPAPSGTASPGPAPSGTASPGPAPSGPASRGPASSGPGTTDAIDPQTGLSYGELREIVGAVVRTLEFPDQDILLLALRHGLTAEDIAATLGIRRRAARRRVAAARSHLAAGLSDELRVRSRRCAEQAAQGTSAQGTSAQGTGAQESAAEHAGQCPDCRRRADISAVALLSLPPGPVLPTALRHRVMHTATDSELAGHRADIVARGGNLTASGLPRQPDVPSQLVRRWVFTGSGVVGVLATVTAAIMLFDPGLPIPSIDWFDRNPPHSPLSPSGAPTRPNRSALPAAEGSAGPPAPQGGTPTPAPTDGETPAPSPTATGPGVLKVGPDVVAMDTGQDVALLKLTAYTGDVTWSATSSSKQLLLSIDAGTIRTGETQEVKLSLRYGTWTFPGKATVTFTTLTRGPFGDMISHNVQVTWKGSTL